MKLLAKYIHGSEDSTDTDVVYVVDEIPSLQEAKAFCSADKSENRNLITVDERKGVVMACYKGSIDEINNSLIDTYDLHEQTDPLLVKFRRCRDIPIKCMRSLRIILSHLSRSQFRTQIKEALHGCWNERLETLELLADNLDKIDFDTLNKKMSGDDIKKVIAFQIGQCSALLDDVEIYTKGGLAAYYPTLKPYLYRCSTSIDDLKGWMHQFCDILQPYISRITGSDQFKTIWYDTNYEYDLIAEKKIHIL